MTAANLAVALAVVCTQCGRPLGSTISQPFGDQPCPRLHVDPCDECVKRGGLEHAARTARESALADIAAAGASLLESFDDLRAQVERARTRTTQFTMGKP